MFVICDAPHPARTCSTTGRAYQCTPRAVQLRSHGSVEPAGIAPIAGRLVYHRGREHVSRAWLAWQSLPVHRYKEKKPYGMTQRTFSLNIHKYLVHAFHRWYRGP